jgi:hypothetical protein
VPEDTLHTVDVDEVTDVLPSPVVLTDGTKLPLTTATSVPGRFVIVGVEGVPGLTVKLCCT